MELLAYAQVRMAGSIRGSGTRLSLRLLVSATSVLSGQGPSLATNPEDASELDRQWLFDSTDRLSSNQEVMCTASEAAWRFAVGNVPFEIAPGSVTRVPIDAWGRAMIETAATGRGEWVAAPRTRAHAYVFSTPGGQPVPMSLSRVEFDRQSSRMQCVWRGERPLALHEIGGRVIALTNRSEEGPPPAEVRRRTMNFSAELVVHRSVAEDVPPCLAHDAASDNTLSMHGFSPALPFGHDSLGMRAPAAPSEPPRFDSPIEQAVSDRAPGAASYGPSAIDLLPSERGLSVGQRLAHSSPARAAELPPDLGRHAPARSAPGLSVLWWQDDIVKRMRRQPELRALLPKMRRVEAPDAARGDERTRADIARVLAHVDPADASRPGSAHTGNPPGSPREELVIVRGALAPDFEEVATLSALLGAVFALRKGNPKIEEAATDAEQLLEHGRVADAPESARGATTRLLEAVRSVRQETAVHVQEQMSTALVRGRKYALRTIGGEQLVRARLSSGPGPEAVVTYLTVEAAAMLPLLRQTACVIMGSFGPAMEEGDDGPVLRVRALVRQIS